jgi:hypothetical protein
MCAQSQVLYKIGGFSEELIRNLSLTKKDQVVAQLLDISVAHSVLLRKVNDGQPGAPSNVLTNPEKYLGPNFLRVLGFWRRLDYLSVDQWKKIAERLSLLDPASCLAAELSATRAAPTVAAASEFEPYPKKAATCASYAGMWANPYLTGANTGATAAEYATDELISHIENPLFVPLFDNLDG